MEGDLTVQLSCRRLSCSLSLAWQPNYLFLRPPSFSAPDGPHREAVSSIRTIVAKLGREGNSPSGASYARAPSVMGRILQDLALKAPCLVSLSVRRHCYSESL